MQKSYEIAGIGLRSGKPPIDTDYSILLLTFSGNTDTLVLSGTRMSIRLWSQDLTQHIFIKIVMNSPIEKAYEPKSFEKRIYQKWEETGTFIADANSSKKPFVISMPPPNATGQLHVGHAVMLAIEDILIRWHRMQGYEALWLPGTDHAAIATENVVLKKIKEEERIKNPRETLGREEVLKRIFEYVENSRGTIRNQIRALGASCDWSRERFTMDPQLNRCVNSIFNRMYEQGLIYRGNRIVNWDPTLQTTISDDEIDHVETMSTLYYMQYGPFVVATSRPETKLGDTGIAVHPEDERYTSYIGQTLTVTWPKGQEIQVKVFGNTHVDPKFGSGVIGVTPAHSQIDFDMAQEHNLEILQIIGENGCMLETAGCYQGMTVKECREAFIQDLEAAGLMVKKEPYQQPLSICYRSKQPIEPLPKKQWFIDVNKPVVSWKGKTQSLKAILIEVVRSNQINIVPERFNTTYFHWVENLKDWCISRQIWWGHQVPVWYRKEEIHVDLQPPQGEGWEQDPDTLDTWFSSALWTWSTLIDPKQAQDYTLSFEELLKRSPDFQKFHPTHVMETGYDILFFWVARMILMTTYMIGDIPFENVYLHGMVRTREGKKMSKSDPEHCIDPLESIDQYGTDALRLALVSGTAPGMDLKLYPEKLESCKRFVNKLWNAGRYILITIPPDTPSSVPQKVQSPYAQWMLHRLNQLTESVQGSLIQFRLSDVIENLRQFFWGDFCDWYLEMDKKPERNAEDNQVLCYAYTTLLKLMHPYIPFVTEALWEHFQTKEMLIKAAWPKPCEEHHFPEAEAQISLIQEAITQIRALRDKANIGLNQKVEASIDSVTHVALFQEHQALMIRLARLSNLVTRNQEPNANNEALSSYFSDTLVQINASAVDWTQELENLGKKLNNEEAFVLKSIKKLENPNFINNAPTPVIAELKGKIETSQKTIDALKQQIDELKSLANP
ncbi:valine--tRNA ligase [Deltaproteobacteria bacterium TL4]